MRKTRDAIFFAEQMPSGFFAVYANGDPKFLNASLGSVMSVREFVCNVAHASKLTCYTLTFHREEYRHILEEMIKKEV